MKSPHTKENFTNLASAPFTALRIPTKIRSTRWATGKAWTIPCLHFVHAAFAVTCCCCCCCGCIGCLNGCIALVCCVCLYTKTSIVVDAAGVVIMATAPLATIGNKTRINIGDYRAPIIKQSKRAKTVNTVVRFYWIVTSEDEVSGSVYIVITCWLGWAAGEYWWIAT